MRWTVFDDSFEVFERLSGFMEFPNGNIIKKARRCLLEHFTDTLNWPCTSSSAKDTTLYSKQVLLGHWAMVSTDGAGHMKSFSNMAPGNSPE